MDKKENLPCTLSRDSALKIFGVGAFIFTLICTVLATLSRTLFFDEIGYYQAEAIVPKMFFVLCLCFVAFIAAFCFIPGICVEPDTQKNTLPVRAASLLLALGFISAASELIYEIFIAIEESVFILDSQTFIYLILPLAVRILAAIHFVRAGIVKDASGTFSVIGNICFIIYILEIISGTYFNVLIPMNSPTTTLLYLALLSAMLLFINESRIGFDADKKGFFAFSAALTTLFCAAFCVSEAFVAYDIANDPLASPAATTINSYFPTILLIFIFATARLYSICFMKEEPCEASEDFDAESEKSEEVKENEESVQEEQEISRDNSAKSTNIADPEVTE